MGSVGWLRGPGPPRGRAQQGVTWLGSMKIRLCASCLRPFFTAHTNSTISRKSVPSYISQAPSCLHTFAQPIPLAWNALPFLVALSLPRYPVRSSDKPPPLHVHGNCPTTCHSTNIHGVSTTLLALCVCTTLPLTISHLITISPISTGPCIENSAERHHYI